jgi:hypothetical protein
MIPELGQVHGTSDIYDLLEFNYDVLRFNYYSFILLLARFSNVLWTLFVLGVAFMVFKMYQKLNKIKKVARVDDPSRSPHRVSVSRGRSPHRSASHQ